METKKLVFSALTVIIFILLATQIKAHKQEIGKEIDYDKTWEETKAVFPVLELVPKFTDTVDYWEWHKRESNGYMGLDIGFREVKNPEEKVKDIQKTLEDAGFEVYETETVEPDVKRPYETVKHYIRLQKNIEGGKKLTVKIEWFELEYKHSHNIYIQIFP